MKYLTFLKSIHDRLLGLMSAIKFDKTQQVHFARIALYASLIEFSNAMICLIENNGRVALPSTFRSFLEAAVELKNLNADPNYIEYMYASHIEEWLKVLHEAKRKNPYLEGIGEIPRLDELIQKDEASLTRLKKKGKRSLKIIERFETAGMIEEYRSLYNFLSCDSHSNIRSLIRRHFEETEGNFDVVMYRDEPIESFLATLDTTAALLLEGSLQTHNAFKTGKSEMLDAMFQELTELRKTYA